MNHLYKKFSLESARVAGVRYSVPFTVGVWRRSYCKPYAFGNHVSCDFLLVTRRSDIPYEALDAQIVEWSFGHPQEGDESYELMTDRSIDKMQLVLRSYEELAEELV